MRFLSVCSGIEAASAAWGPLGWQPVGFSEIEPFPCALLAHHYPTVPNFGDMTKFKDWPSRDELSIDLLCGGTPCQSFSVAGLRKGLDDPRGNLMLTYLAIADKYRPEWLVWENVPAAKRFVSIEPMLGAINIKRSYLDGMSEGESFRDSTGKEHKRISYGPKLDWVICGGESGKDARPMHPDWPRSLRDQCVSAGTSFFFKQWGEYVPAAWFDGPDSLGDDEECCFDPEKEPHAFIANDGREWNTNGGRYMYPPLPLGHWCLMRRVGTKAAGNLLDGKTWTQFPDEEKK